MKKFSAIACALLLSVSQVAFAKIGSRNLEEDVKLRQVCYPAIFLPTVGTDVTVGTGGIVGTKSANGVSSITLSSATTELSSLPYPAKLNVIMYDASANGTVVCTAAVITGTDQFGSPIKETVAVTESAATTTAVWATVSNVAATGCSGGSTGDLIQVYVSTTIGLGVKIASTADVESMCLDDAGSELKCVAQDDNTALDISSKASVSTHSYDLSGTAFGTGSKVAAADNDGLCFSVRSSRTRSF